MIGAYLSQPSWMAKHWTALTALDLSLWFPQVPETGARAWKDDGSIITPSTELVDAGGTYIGPDGLIRNCISNRLSVGRLGGQYRAGRTNDIPNSKGTGGSGPTIPTGWPGPFVSSGNITVTVDVQDETELTNISGVKYVDIIVSTNGDAVMEWCIIEFCASAVIAASENDERTVSMYARLQSGVQDGNFNLRTRWNDAASAFIEQDISTRTPTSTYQRFQAAHTAPALTAWAQPSLTISSVGANKSFTIRIALPQNELEAFASPWIPTTTASVTVAATQLRYASPSELLIQGSEGTIITVYTPFFSGNAPENSVVVEHNKSIQNGVILFVASGDMTWRVDSNATISCNLSDGLGGFTSGQSYAYAATWKLDDYRLSRDGVQRAFDGLGPAPLTLSDTIDLSIGLRSESDTWHAKGLQAHTMIFKRALSQEQENWVIRNVIAPNFAGKIKLAG